jgi:mannosyl-3-phosphoglycerate phosphatase
MRIACAVTDLDGTLLDHGGVLGRDARAAIGALGRFGIPVVPLTSKTDVELRGLLADLDSGGIGGFENGAGVLGPRGDEVSERAVPVADLEARLAELSRLAGLPLTPVSALPTEEIRRITGLSEERVPAMLARRFGLPFLAPEGAGTALEPAVRRLPGLRLTRGGLFWHLSGDHGKEDSLDLLLRRGLISRPLAGFGDAPNDAGFLALCDVVILVPGSTGSVDAHLAAAFPSGRAAPFPAGRGWAAAVERLLEEES